MPNKRDLKLGEYNISKYAYRELMNFCLQYPEKKRRLVDYHSPLKAMMVSDMPHSTSPGEPTAIAGERAAQLSKDCELIENTAKEISAENYQYILCAVSEDVPWRYLNMLKGLKVGEWSFRKMRRKFFHLLAQKRGMI